MKIPWFKSSKTVENPAQAGDAALWLHFGNSAQSMCDLESKDGMKTFSRETKVHTNERMEFNTSYHHGQNLALFFWGVVKGLVQIPLTQPGSFYESIWAQNFTKEEMEEFTHIVSKSVSGSLELHQDQTEKVDIYRLTDTERNCIVNKNRYF
jgi:hypothetical protein